MRLTSNSSIDRIIQKEDTFVKLTPEIYALTVDGE
jgi:hypothetical protein